MPEYKYDVAVFIGRFQIFHDGHLKVIERALQLSRKVVVIIGSANVPRSPRNPFTYTERSGMIFGAVSEFKWDRLKVLSVDDVSYSDTEWISNIRAAVDAKNTDKVALIGHAKDNSSYYLRMFPDWSTVNVENHENISSTALRDEYFIKGNTPGDVPSSTVGFLRHFRMTTDYENLREEMNFVSAYKKSWESAPFPPIFVTVDTIVVVGAHVLLVKRKAQPGKGLYAIPGGFIKQDEMLVDSAIRELREETRIKVPEPVLRGSIIHNEVFDEPNRSSRGRTITHAYLIHLKNETTLPKVTGADDAEKAVWVPINTINSSNMYEDHYSIVRKMIKTI